MTLSSNVYLVRGVCAMFFFPKTHFIILSVFKVCDSLSICLSFTTSEQLKHRNSDNLYVWCSDTGQSYSLSTLMN